MHVYVNQQYRIDIQHKNIISINVFKMCMKGFTYKDHGVVLKEMHFSQRCLLKVQAMQTYETHKAYSNNKQNHLFINVKLLKL